MATTAVLLLIGGGVRLATDLNRRVATVRGLRKIGAPARRPGRRRLAALLALVTVFAAAATVATAEFVDVARAWL